VLPHLTGSIDFPQKKYFLLKGSMEIIGGFLAPQFPLI
jgi:hypothetical protein